MPYKYVRKTSRGSWSEADMNMAMHLVKEGYKMRSVCRAYNVPRATLSRHVGGKLKKDPGSNKLSGGGKLGKENEEKLLEYIFKLKHIGFKINNCDIRRLAFEYANANKINHFIKPSYLSSKMVGRDWVRGFRNRHSDRLLLEPYSIPSFQLNKLMNRPEIEKYFEALEQTLNENNILDNPFLIYSVYKGDLNLTSEVKGSKIYEKNQQNVKILKVLIAANANGKYIPPMVIFKGEKISNLDNSLPLNSIVCFSDTDYVTQDILLIWINHFANHRQGKSKKCVLLLDTQDLHKMCSTRILDFCLENNILMFGIPPQSSGYLIPMNNHIFNPIKMQFLEAVREYLDIGIGAKKENLQMDLAKLLTKQYYSVATESNTIKAYLNTGLYPVDISVIPKEYFAPYKPTEKFTLQNWVNIEPPSNYANELLKDNETTEVNIVENIDKIKDDKKSFVCKICDKIHLTITERTYPSQKVTVCKCCFDDSDKVSQLQMMMGNPPFQCCICQENILTNEPYTCVDCNKNFQSIELLQDHMVEH